jgi:hypothetical protein
MNHDNHGFGFKLLAEAANRLWLYGYIPKITNEITNHQNGGFGFKLLAGAANRLWLYGYVP